MNKATITLLILGSFVVGGVAGAFTMSKVKTDDKLASNDTSTTSKATEQSIPPATKKKISGHGMTPAEMADELLLVPEGREFDWRYLNYLQVFRLNETAMSRIAAEKATQPELKAAAAEQLKLSDELSTQLFQWRTVWGFTDH
jgi:uncharacterized protein (DUF305 family)